MPAAVWSQGCFGTARLNDGPLRLGVSRAKPGNDDVRAGHLGLGEFAGAFVDASYSRIKPLSDPETDGGGYEYGATIGVDRRVWHNLYFCPTLEVQQGRLNSVFLAPRSPSGERTDDRFVSLGGAVGPSSGAHGGVVVSPTAGVWFARDRGTAGAGAATSIRDYGISKIGVGLVILRRYSVSLIREREFGTAAALPGFAVLQASIDVGK